MEARLEPEKKRELIKIILDAGLEEDFMKWLEMQGYTYFFGRLDNIPDELVETYVRVKKLVIEEDEDQEIFKEAITTPELEPPARRNYIPAKKPRKNI